MDADAEEAVARLLLLSPSDAALRPPGEVEVAVAVATAAAARQPQPAARSTLGRPVMMVLGGGGERGDAGVGCVRGVRACVLSRGFVGG